MNKLKESDIDSIRVTGNNELIFMMKSGHIFKSKKINEVSLPKTITSFDGGSIGWTRGTEMKFLIVINGYIIVTCRAQHIHYDEAFAEML